MFSFTIIKNPTVHTFLVFDFYCGYLHGNMAKSALPLQLREIKRNRLHIHDHCCKAVFWGQLHVYMNSNALKLKWGPGIGGGGGGCSVSTSSSVCTIAPLGTLSSHRTFSLYVHSPANISRCLSLFSSFLFWSSQSTFQEARLRDPKHIHWRRGFG